MIRPFFSKIASFTSNWSTRQDFSLNFTDFSVKKMLFKISEICCEITVKFPKFLRTHFVKSICEQLLLTLGQLLLSCFFKSYMTLEDLPNYYPQVFWKEAIVKMTACFFQNWTSSLIVSEHFSQDLSLKKIAHISDVFDNETCSC